MFVDLPCCTFLACYQLLAVRQKLANTIGAKTAFAAYRQAGGVEGIVNGMDTTDWSPNVDKFLDVKYDADTVDEGKALAKATLQAELGLPVSILPHVPPANMFCLWQQHLPILWACLLVADAPTRCTAYYHQQHNSSAVNLFLGDPTTKTTLPPRRIHDGHGA